MEQNQDSIAKKVKELEAIASKETDQKLKEAIEKKIAILKGDKTVTK